MAVVPGPLAYSTGCCCSSTPGHLCHARPAVVWCCCRPRLSPCSPCPSCRGAARRCPVAVVDAANCNGCCRCFDDCPTPPSPWFRTRTAHRPRDGAGQCRPVRELRHLRRRRALRRRRSAASPLVTGIDMPSAPIKTLRRQLQQALARPASAPHPIVVFGCAGGAGVDRLAAADVAPFSLTCAPALPPSVEPRCATARHGGRAGCREGWLRVPSRPALERRAPRWRTRLCTCAHQVPRERRPPPGATRTTNRPVYCSDLIHRRTPVIVAPRQPGASRPWMSARSASRHPPPGSAEGIALSRPVCAGHQRVLALASYRHLGDDQADHAELQPHRPLVGRPAARREAELAKLPPNMRLPMLRPRERSAPSSSSSTSTVRRRLRQTRKPSACPRTARPPSTTGFAGAPARTASPCA